VKWSEPEPEHRLSWRVPVPASPAHLPDKRYRYGRQDHAHGEGVKYVAGTLRHGEVKTTDRDTDTQNKTKQTMPHNTTLSWEIIRYTLQCSGTVC